MWQKENCVNYVVHSVLCFLLQSATLYLFTVVIYCCFIWPSTQPQTLTIHTEINRDVQSPDKATFIRLIVSNYALIVCFKTWNYCAFGMLIFHCHEKSRYFMYLLFQCLISKKYKKKKKSQQCLDVNQQLFCVSRTTNIRRTHNCAWLGLVALVVSISDNNSSWMMWA
jgi:hypothetical protein